jgi:hypothetical protein
MSSTIIYLSDCTPLYTILGAPERITNVIFTPLNRSMRLEWSPPPNSENVLVDSYLIRYKIAGAPLTQTLGEYVSFFTTFTVPNLVNGEFYEFWVIARNRFGESPHSPTVSGAPGTAPSASQIVRRAYHSTTPGTDSTTTFQKVGIEFTPPVSVNGSVPLVFRIKYTRLAGGGGGSLTDVSYVVTESVQTNEIMRDVSNNLAIKTEGVKTSYIRKEVTIPTGSAGFVTAPYRFEVFTNNLYGFSAAPDISFVVDLYSSTTDPTRPRFTAPSFSYYTTPANAGIVSTTTGDATFRFRWKQYRPNPAIGGTPDSGWSYRIQYTDDKDYWYYPPPNPGQPSKYPEYTVAYDTTSQNAATDAFEYFIDISRNVLNGRRYYVRYCVVNANGDTSEYTQVTDTNLSLVSVIPGKLPNPPPIFRAAVDDRLVRLFFIWDTRTPSLELTGGLPVLDYKIERYIVSRDGDVVTVLPDINAVFENIPGPYYEDRFDIQFNGVEYFYKIYTRTSIGYSTLFTTVSAIPSRKSDIVYDVTASVDNQQISLSWSPPTNIESGLPIVQYYIEYRVYDIFTVPAVPPTNIVGTIVNPPLISTTIQDMNSILINDTTWSLLTTNIVSVFTSSITPSYTIRDLINNTPYAFRIAAVTQDKARRNIVGLIKVIGTKSPYLPRPVVVGKVPSRMTNVNYSIESGSVRISWSSSNINNTEGILRFIVDYRVFGSGSTYLTQTFEYVNSVIFNNQFDSVTFSVLVTGLENNVTSRPLTNTHSYEMVIYSENSVGYTNVTDRVDLHEDLVYTNIETLIYADIYENLTIPRLVRPATAPRVIAEVR